MEAGPNGDVEAGVEDCTRSWGTNEGGTTSESAPTWLSGSQRPATCQSPDASTQSTTCWSKPISWAQAIGPAILHPGDARRQPGGAEHVRRAAFKSVREVERLSRAGGVASGAAFAPRANLPVSTRAHVKRTCAGGTIQRLVSRKGQQVNGDPAEVDRHDAGRSAASTRKSAPASRTIAPTEAMGCTVPSTFDAWVMTTSVVRDVSARRIASGSM